MAHGPLVVAPVTAPVPPYPTYDTYEKAVTEQQRRKRRENGGMWSGIIRVGDRYALRCDVTWTPA
jgi:hypothetical protein